MDFKLKVHLHYKQIIADKIQLLQLKLADLKEMGSNETKSTAGDKHETALAMVQIEQANIRSQLSELIKQKEIFDKINTEFITPQILNGSLIKTDKGHFYLSIALGKAIIDGILIIALSSESPLGAKMKGLLIGDKVEMNKIKYTIQQID
jgi:hypothetical protein